jgi:hypothetical protein
MNETKPKSNWLDGKHYVQLYQNMYHQHRFGQCYLQTNREWRDKTLRYFSNSFFPNVLENAAFGFVSTATSSPTNKNCQKMAAQVSLHRTVKNLTYSGIKRQIF